MTPRSSKPGVSSTWVTSQWKFMPFPGHFSAAINTVGSRRWQRRRRGTGGRWLWNSWTADRRRQCSTEGGRHVHWLCRWTIPEHCSGRCHFRSRQSRSQYRAGFARHTITCCNLCRERCGTVDVCQGYAERPRWEGTVRPLPSTIESDAGSAAASHRPNQRRDTADDSGEGNECLPIQHNHGTPPKRVDHLCPV